MTRTTMVKAARLAFSAVALAVGLGAEPARAVDPFFPSFGNRGYDVRHYDLALIADPNRNTLSGTARIEITALRRLASLSLDLAGLTVEKVTLDGAALTFQHQRDKLSVVLPRYFSERERFRLVVHYAGSPKPLPDPTAPGADPPYPLGWIGYRDTTYVVSEPVGASTFFPVNDEPTDKATYSFTIFVPRPYVAAANGLLTKVEDFGSMRGFSFEQRQPMASWLATVHVNRFEVERQTGSGIPLRYYTTRATTAEEMRAIRRTPAMLDFMIDRVGKYPFDAYGVALVDDPELYYALETQALSTFGPDTVDVPTLVHELAHQWFGNAVSVARWADLWLAEGFATYFEVLYPNRDDKAGFNADMRAIYRYVARKGIGPAVVDKPEQMFSDRTYLRGAMALYALQRQVGERTFFDILRRWYETYNGGNATSEDFVALAVETSRDRAVRDLLRAWLYEEPVPALPGQDEETAAAASIDPEQLVARLRAHHRGGRQR